MIDKIGYLFSTFITIVVIPAVLACSKNQTKNNNVIGHLQDLFTDSL